jgi:hypothetical protein
MYETVTATAAAQVEVEQIRHRAFSMAITADDADGSDGCPTSWSASVDALAFGTDIRHSPTGIELLGDPDPSAARLFVVSAGNVLRSDWQVDHLVVSDTRRVQSPAHAWNALTVATRRAASEDYRGRRPGPGECCECCESILPCIPGDQD